MTLERDRLSLNNQPLIHEIASLRAALASPQADPDDYGHLSEKYTNLATLLGPDHPATANFETLAAQALTTGIEADSPFARQVALVQKLKSDRQSHLHLTGSMHEFIESEILSIAKHYAYRDVNQTSRRSAEIALVINDLHAPALYSLGRYYAESDPEKALEFIESIQSPDAEHYPAPMQIYFDSLVLGARICERTGEDESKLIMMLNLISHAPKAAELWLDLKKQTPISGPIQILADLDRAIKAEPDNKDHVLVKGLFMASTTQHCLKNLESTKEGTPRSIKMHAWIDAVRGGDKVLKNALKTDTRPIAFVTAASAHPLSEAIQIMRRGLHVPANRQQPVLLNKLSTLWTWRAALTPDKIQSAHYLSNGQKVHALERRVRKRLKTQPA